MRTSTRSGRWLPIFAVVVALSALAACGSSKKTSTPSGTTTRGTTTTSVGATTTAPSGTGTTTGTTTPPGFPYQPLYPFAGLSDADAWRASYREGGHQPWHLDASQTALSFTTGYLGFTEVDKVLASTVGAREAHVTVGYAIQGGQTGTSAVVHLAKLGSGADAPWEVVGTDDAPTFTLTTPAYAAAVSSPITVGGSITGVDESIRVQVRGLSSQNRLGDACCTPAGGEGTHWSIDVTFPPTSDKVLTLAASTGGHVQSVERFAVTGVRVR